MCVVIDRELKMNKRLQWGRIWVKQKIVRHPARDIRCCPMIRWVMIEKVHRKLDPNPKSCKFLNIITRKQLIPH